MPTYVFFLINHLGEPFEASELTFEDDQQANAHAASLLTKGYPVEVRSDGKRIKLLEKQMLEHARNLEFEKAARVRDQLAVLREQAFGAAGHDSNVIPLVGKG